MRKLLNDLSIRGKLVLLISGCVCVLTAAVLTVVWVQSLQQVRAIVQDQLAADRQLFASTERSHYQSRAYKGTALASSPAVVEALEHNDQAAACAFLSRVLAAPRFGPSDDDLDYVSIRRTDGSILAFAVQNHPVCDPQTLSWHLPDVYEALSGAPEITTWTGPDNAVYRVFARSV